MKNSQIMLNMLAIWTISPFWSFCFGVPKTKPRLLSHVQAGEAQRGFQRQVRSTFGGSAKKI